MGLSVLGMKKSERDMADAPTAIQMNFPNLPIVTYKRRSLRPSSSEASETPMPPLSGDSVQPTPPGTQSDYQHRLLLSVHKFSNAIAIRSHAINTISGVMLPVAFFTYVIVMMLIV